MHPFDYYLAHSIDDALVRLSQNKDVEARVLNGGTDLIVQLRERQCYADLLVDIKSIPEVNELSYDPGNGLYLQV